MNTSKRTRLNHATVVGNCISFVRQITTQMPGDLGDVDKTYLAHFIGLHALAHYSMYDRHPGVSGLASHLLSPSSLSVFASWLPSLMWSFIPDDGRHLGGMPMEAERMKKVYKKAGADLPADLKRFDQQIMPLIDGLNMIDPSWHYNNSDNRRKVYSYVLMHEGLRGFQHYERRIKLLIPANLEMFLREMQIVLKDYDRRVRESERVQKEEHNLLAPTT